MVVRAVAFAFWKRYGSFCRKNKLKIEHEQPDKRTTSCRAELALRHQGF
jgi:hypothetical protein